MIVLSGKSKPQAASDGTAVILSTQANAVGIALSLREVGWAGPIVCLKVNRTRHALAERWPRLCECWEVELTEPADLPAWLAQRIPADVPKTLFFTDERFLPVFRDGQHRRVLSNTGLHVGTVEHLETVLDRRRFYEFVSARGLASVPRTVASSEDPWKTFGSEFRVRAWRSWRGMDKLPRGANIRSRGELAAWLALCQAQKLGQQEWGYQELLSCVPQHNVSVCGWHDRGFRLYQTTRKVREKDENGWIVEAIDDPAELETVARAILSALDYCGPFEMEFLLDPSTGEYKANELNPRFWLQHRLTGILCDNHVVRRYLGWELASGAHACGKKPRFWLDTDQVLRRLLTLRGFGLLRYMAQGVWAYPLTGSLARWLRPRRERVKPQTGA